MASIPWLTEDIIRTSAAKNSYNRGKGIRGDVSLPIVIVDGMTFRARVVGSSVYSVTIRVRGTDLDCECSCPDSRPGFCKHIVAALLHMLPTGNTVRSSSPKSTPIYQTTSPVRSILNPSIPTSTTPTNDEISQLARNYTSSKDGSLRAKIATIIYKNSKEATDMAVYNSDSALTILLNLVRFCVNNTALMRELPGGVETISKACSYTLTYANNTSQINQLKTLCQSDLWCTPVENAHWKNVGEIASRRVRPLTSSLQNYRQLIGDSVL